MINNVNYVTSPVLLGLVDDHMSFLLSKVNSNNTHSKIIDALKILLNGAYGKYVTSNNERDLRKKLSNDSFQEILSSLNEKSVLRKIRGVYYTPNDVTSYIINSCFKIYLSKTVISKEKLDTEGYEDLLFNAFVFDPTCGSGEFLYDALKIKIKIMETQIDNIVSEHYLRLVNTIKGNDLDPESVEITKIRLFFEVLKYVDDSDYITLAEVLNSNFYVSDYINADVSEYGDIDIIIGNPPYVEDSKSDVSLPSRYGNIYANVMDNSIHLLKDGGIVGLIVPISYISTPRMKKIRALIRSNTDFQTITNYADRPDCLFTAVHQKLSIIVARKGSDKHLLYTSDYNYWYTSERDKLFNQISVLHNKYVLDDFYPKLGNVISAGIFDKVYTNKVRSLFEEYNVGGNATFCVNMRATFWIKAFSFNPGSNEYKLYSVSPEKRDFIVTLLNSSLFFWYWTVVSDCWHITSKEWKSFRMPDVNIDKDLFKSLRVKLEKSLEETKEYVGTVQTEYAYKHKLCKNVIDEIDDALMPIYGLTKSESDYIKNYAIKYRESRGS